MGYSEAATQGIRVTAHSFYVPERSRPADDHYFFAYRITISNEGGLPARLVSRHWVITRSDGRTEEVQGPGVVGETPRLEPGASFEYTSFCPLSTTRGSMRGSYQMQRDDGGAFDAEIAAFSLELPADLN